jgi:ribosomal protein S2
MLDVKKEKKKYYSESKPLTVGRLKKKKIKHLWLPPISQKFKNLLILINTFQGNTTTFLHSSQYPYLLGIKNYISFYNISRTSFLLINALNFLKLARRDKNNFFVVVGAPRNFIGTNLSYILNKLPNVKFFPSTRWKPGFLSKFPPIANIILILFNPTLHNDTLREGIYSKIPVVGFVTPFCNISGIDYPVLLNLKEQETWYLNLIYSILRN